MSASGAVTTELTELRKSGGILSKKIMLGENAPENSFTRAYLPAATGPASRLNAGWFRRHPPRAHRVYRPCDEDVEADIGLIDHVLRRCRVARP